MDPSPVKTEPFWIGAWHVRPSLNRIEGPDGDVQLEPRVMDVLCCLAASAGQVVSRETLHATVWSDVVVGDDPLNRAVSTLRKLFGDDARQPTHIETIRKVGYRLIAPVEDGPLPTADTSGLTLSPAVHGDGTALPHPRGDGLSNPLPSTPARAPRAMPWLLGLGALALLGWIGMGLWNGRAGETPPTNRPETLTTLPGREADPALSPTGDRVAYVWDGDRGDFDLFVRTVAEAPPLQLTEGPAEDRSPAWSPDGQTVAFLRHDADGCSIRRVPVLGGRPQQIALCLDAVDLAWGESGLAVADRAAPGAPYRILLLDPESGEATPLTEPPAAPGDASVGDRSPAFSPDGRQLVFVRQLVPGLDHLYTVPVDGGAPRRQSEETQRIGNPAWPEPDVLVYASDWNGPTALYRRSLRDGTVTWLAGGGDGLHHPTARAGRVVYEERSWDKNIWVAPLDGEPPYELLASTRWDHSPDVDPDGRIVFVSSRAGSYEIWLWTPETGQAEALTEFGGPVVGRPRWSPDGQSVAFDVRTEGHSALYVLELDGGPPRVVTGPANAIHAAWSPDGSSLYHASDASGTWEIWRTPLDGGTPERITDAGGYVPSLGPEGDGLYYAKAGVDGLWRRPLDGGPETLVTDALRSTDYRNWAVTPRAVVLVTRGAEAEQDAEAGARLARLALATGALTEFARPDRPVANLGLAMMGDRLLYVQVDRSAADLMRLDF